MTNGTQFSNCSHFSTEELKSVNLAFSVSGAVCFFISSGITLVLFISKSYHSVLQRLLLYLMIATALNELFLAASIEHHFVYKGQQMVCSWIGFVFNWTIFLRIVFTIGIMVYLFVLVSYLAKGNTIPHFLQSRHRRVLMEVAYVIFTPVFTLAYASVPMFTHNYGLAGAWCWVGVLDKHCNLLLSGLLNQLVHGYIFFVANSIVGIILMMAVAIVYCNLSVTLPESRQLLKKTFFVLVNFFLYVILRTFAFAYRMTTLKKHYHQHIAMWYAVGISYPVGVLLFPIAFVVSFYPVHKLYRSARALKCFRCKKKKRSVHFEQQPNYTTRYVPTFQDSTRVSPPSDTFFHVPYTNEFTHVTTENVPIVSNNPTDTGYGSVSHGTL